MTLDSWQSADALNKVACAISVLEKALDNLWTKLPVEVVKRMPLELEHFNSGLVTKLKNLADDIQDEGEEADRAA